MVRYTLSPVKVCLSNAVDVSDANPAVEEPMGAGAAAAYVSESNVMDAVEDVMVEDTRADSHSGLSISVDIIKVVDSNTNSQLSN